MFLGQELQMKIRDIRSSVKGEDNALRRVSTLALQCDLTQEVAAGISEKAEMLQQQLANGDLKSAVVPLAGTAITAEFSDGDEAFKLESLGNKADLKRANKEDANPTVKLELSFDTANDAIIYFTDHLEQSLVVKMTKKQLELPGT